MSPKAKAKAKAFAKAKAKAKASPGPKAKGLPKAKAKAKAKATAKAASRPAVVEESPDTIVAAPAKAEDEAEGVDVQFLPCFRPLAMLQGRAKPLRIPRARAVAVAAEADRMTGPAVELIESLVAHDADGPNVVA